VDLESGAVRERRAEDLPSAKSCGTASSAPEQRYDVAIIGGALSGAAAALLLLREHPTLRILIIEKSTAFTRRVGEATVEISAYFLGRVLGLTQYLNEAQLVKQGMRFWFANADTKTLADCSEFGGRYLSRVAAYQVDPRRWTRKSSIALAPPGRNFGARHRCHALRSIPARIRPCS